MMDEGRLDDLLLDEKLIARLQRCSNLPSPPGVGLRIIELARDPEVDIGKVADVIKMDPALAAKILRVTNSPLYAVRRKTENLHQAIMLLGLNGTISLALSFSLVTSTTGSESHGLDYNLFWERSLATAICGRRLGTVIKAGGGEDLFLAGLLQDIGMLVLDRMDPEFYHSIGGDQSDHLQLQHKEREILGVDHSAVGAWMLQQWELPLLLQTAVWGSHDIQVVGEDCKFLPFVQSVWISGPLADVARSEDPRQALELVTELAEQRMGIERHIVTETLQALDADLREAEVLFEVDLQNYTISESLLDQAKETLMLRNLQAFQQTNQLQEATGVLESKTRELEEKNKRDVLTGLYNRAYMDQKLTQEFSATKERDWEISVMFVDLDHFKRVNDTYGHQAGDCVLEKSARILCECTRDQDIVARYGGEEFVIIMPGRCGNVARIVAERLVKKFRATTHLLADGQEVVVTASIGVATQSGHTGFDSAAELISAADHAVYDAKHHGRNRVVSYGQELEKEYPDNSDEITSTQHV